MSACLAVRQWMEFHVIIDVSLGPTDHIHQFVHCNHTHTSPVAERAHPAISNNSRLVAKVVVKRKIKRQFKDSRIVCFVLGETLVERAYFI